MPSPMTRRPFRLIGNFQLRRRPPQPLQIVVVPGLLAEHMHNEAPKIQQRPFRRPAPLAMLRAAQVLEGEGLTYWRHGGAETIGAEDQGGGGFSFICSRSRCSICCIMALRPNKYFSNCVVMCRGTTKN